MSVPYEKLHFFREKIGVGREDWDNLKPYHRLFSERRHDFAQYFYDFFFAIPETRLILRQQASGDHLRAAWADWFRSLFTLPLDESLLSYIWRIGIRHVEVYLDQRFSNLGFSLARQYCYRMMSAEVPVEKLGPVLSAVDKLLDLSLLIETSAYIENTTRCDLRVMQEMADRVRNPITVIGGNIRRLQRHADTESREYDVYERLFSENQKIDAMVRDIKTYMDLFDRDFELEKLEIGEVIDDAVSALRAQAESKGIVIEAKATGLVSGDRSALVLMFASLLQNSIEAVEGGGFIGVSSRSEGEGLENLMVEVLNAGKPPEGEEMEKIFTPFYSTKSGGTGFGLPIAQLIARKHFGGLVVAAAEQAGTKVTITLPRG